MLRWVKSCQFRERLYWTQFLQLTAWLQPWLVWLKWLEHHLLLDQKIVGSILVRAHIKVEGSIPSQGTYERATNQCFSLTSISVCLSVSLSPPTFFLSLQKAMKKMSLGEHKKNKRKIKGCLAPKMKICFCIMELDVHHHRVCS